MKEFTESLFSYSLAVAFFGLKQVDNLMYSGPRNAPRNTSTAAAIQSFGEVTRAHTAQFGDTLTDAFQAADRVQRAFVGLAFEVVLPYVVSTLNRQLQGNTQVVLVDARGLAEPPRSSEAASAAEPRWQENCSVSDTRRDKNV